MTKEELIALADKHQEKADKAYKNYQETGITRYSRDYRNSEDLAAALRMAANAEENHRSLPQSIPASAATTFPSLSPS